ncbi:MAG: hypothetical protein MUO51_01360 [Woeseiaceae bacterium]|nr:hypothetical protein [Woeseiaceae bacterium]
MHRQKLHRLLTFSLAATAACSAHALADTFETGAYDSEAPQFVAMGFGDVGYISKDGSSTDGFGIGQVVAQLSASMGDSFSVFGEFTLTAKEDSHSTGIERLIVKYEFSDHYKLSAGRYHTPIGYWNSAFHHGAWLQTTVSRPEIFKFGSKIAPIHFVGALMEGLIPSGRLGLSYEVGLGNGRHSNISAAGDVGDINSDKAWMVQINAKPVDYYGLNMGIGFYNDEVPLLNGTDVKENTVSAYAAWTKEAPELIFEYLHSQHELLNDSSVSGDVDGWYAQFAYRLSGKHHDWKPYARLEHTRVDDSDPLLGAENLDYDGGILGVRWDFNSYAAIKAEYRNEEYDHAGRENNFRIQVSFALAKL